MSKVITVLAETKKKAEEILKANYGNQKIVTRISAEHNYFKFFSVEPIESTIDSKLPEGRLNEFRGRHHSSDKPVYVLVAIVD